MNKNLKDEVGRLRTKVAILESGLSTVEYLSTITHYGGREINPSEKRVVEPVTTFSQNTQAWRVHGRNGITDVEKELVVEDWPGFPGAKKAKTMYRVYRGGRLLDEYEPY